MDRAAKEELVSHYNGIFENAGVIVVARYSGLSVPEISSLRTRMAEQGGTVKVVKNRLAKRALAGTAVEGLSDFFENPTAIAWSDDPIVAPKIAADFAKENDNLVIVGGAMDAKILDAEEVKRLASLPSLDALRGMIIGLLNAPATKLAGVVQAPAAQLARVVSAKAQQN